MRPGMIPESRHERLDNGLRLVTTELPHLNSVCIAAFATGGMYYETKRNNGVSHFLEHLKFSATPRFPTRDAFHREVDSIPGETNAHVTPEYVAFFIHTAPEYLARASALIADALAIRSFASEEVESERRLILTELAGDKPEWGQISTAKFIAKHPFGLRSAGTPRTVSRLSVGELSEFDRRALCPTRLVVAVSGSIDAQALDEARAAFSALTPSGAGPLRRAWETNGETLQLTCHVARGTRRGASISFYSPTVLTPRERCLQWILARNLQRHAGLMGQLRYGRVQSYHSYIWNEELFGFGAIHIAGTFKRRERLPFARYALEHIRNLRNGNFDERLFREIRDSLGFGIRSALDNPYSISERTGTWELENAHRPTCTIEEDVRLINALSRDDVIDFARQFLARDRAGIIVGTNNPLHFTGRYRRLLDKYLG